MGLRDLPVSRRNLGRPDRWPEGARADSGRLHPRHLGRLGDGRHRLAHGAALPDGCGAGSALSSDQRRHDLQLVLRHRVGVPNGWTNVGLTFGAAATGPLITWLVSEVGWRWSFIATAPLGLILAGIWWWYVRDTPAEHAGVRQTELNLINGSRPAVRQRPEPGGWKRVLRNRQVLLLTSSYFCSNYLFYFFCNWLYIYLVESREFAVLEGGWYAAAPWITGAAGAAIGAYLCDELSSRIGKRRGMRYTGVVGLSLAAGLILLAANAHSPYICVVFLSLCLSCQQMTEGAFWAATISVAELDASTACGVLKTGGNVVGGIGALMVPLMVETLGWPAALAATSVFALVGAGLWFLIDAEAGEAPSSVGQVGIGI
ncbi:MAG: MFS transporter [Pedosphaera sp.]|nr:MFS transporter [Pedosphaera sp.]